MVKAEKVRIIFIGGRDRGYECIQKLVAKGEKMVQIFGLKDDDHEVKKYGKQIEKYARDKKISVKITKSVNNVGDIRRIRKLKPDLIIVLGWRSIIPKEILMVPRLGVIAAHESLLPKYRGFAPVNWAIINGEKETGVTLFYLDEWIDSGDIIAQKKIRIKMEDTADDVYQKTKKVAVDLIMKYLDKVKTQKVKRIKQNERLATYTCARVPKDGLINWSWESTRIYNLIRALSYPYPGALTYYQSKKMIIQKAALVKRPRKYVGRIAGRVVAIDNEGVDVLTGDGLLRIREIDFEGKRQKADKVVRSIKVSLGD